MKTSIKILKKIQELTIKERSKDSLVENPELETIIFNLEQIVGEELSELLLKYKL